MDPGYHEREFICIKVRFADFISFFWEGNGSVVECLTKRPQVRASPASLRCGH